MGKYCQKCEFLAELYERTPKSNRDYWLMTELFVEMHDTVSEPLREQHFRDVCPCADECGYPIPEHGQCLYCGDSFHPDDEGPGVDYCCLACYGWDHYDYENEFEND